MVESLEYFQPLWREQIYATVAPLVNEAGTPLRGYFNLISDDLPLLYSVYDVGCWQTRTADLQSLLQQAGLFGPRELEAIYAWLRQLVQRLWQAGYVNPGLITPLIFKQPAGYYLLEWEYSVPLDDSLQFPRMYEGYHPPTYIRRLDQLMAEGKRSRTLAAEALYATLTELICGRSPVLWSPQPISTRAFRFALSAPLRNWLDSLAEKLEFDRLPPRLPGYYAENSDLVKALSQSNRLFYQAMPLLTPKHAESARKLFDEGVHANLNDAQAFCSLALIAQQDGQQQAFEDYLGRALQIEPLARFYYELAKGRLALNQPEGAIKALQEAVKRFDFYPEAWFLLGQLQHQKHAETQAEEAFLRAWQLRKTPKYAKAIYDFFFAHGLEEYTQQFTNYFSASMGGKLQVRLSETPPRYEPLPPLAAGAELEGYRILSLLNTAQTKDCWNYLAEDTDGRRFYLREYPRAFQQRAKTEIYAVLVLRHPAIQPLVTVFETPRRSTCLVYAELKGESLEDRLRRKGRLTQAEAIEALAEIGSLLLALGQHEPAMVHGDIKPANIFLAESGETLLLDFESVRLLGRDDELVPFTHPYAAPELEKDYALNASTDFYALGLTLIHALSGVFPQEFIDYGKKSISGWEELTLHVDYRLRETLAAWIAWQPEDRQLPTGKTLNALCSQLRGQPELQMPEVMENWLTAFTGVYQSQSAEEVLVWGQRLLACKNTLLGLRFVAGHYLRLGLIKDALKLGLRALLLDPGHVQTSWLVAGIYYDVKLYTQAIRVLLTSLEFCQDQAHSYVMLARCYALSRQLDLALAAYKKAETLPPARVTLQFELLGLLMQCQEYGEVRSRCELLLNQPQLRPGDRAELHTILGALYGKQERFDQALVELLKAYSLRPSPQLSFDIGLSLFQLGRWAEAVEAFSRRLAADSGHVPSQYYLGRAQLELGQAQQALGWLLTVEQSPEKPDDVYFLLGRAHTLLQNLPQAAEMYTNALRLMPDNPAVMVNLGTIRLAQGQTGEALSLARAALREMPSLGQARELEKRALQAGGKAS